MRKFVSAFDKLVAATANPDPVPLSSRTDYGQQPPSQPTPYQHRQQSDHGRRPASPYYFPPSPHPNTATSSPSVSHTVSPHLASQNSAQFNRPPPHPLPHTSPPPLQAVENYSHPPPAQPPANYTDTIYHPAAQVDQNYTNSRPPPIPARPSFQTQPLHTHPLSTPLQPTNSAPVTPFHTAPQSIQPSPPPTTNPAYLDLTSISQSVPGERRQLADFPYDPVPAVQPTSSLTPASNHPKVLRTERPTSRAPSPLPGFQNGPARDPRRQDGSKIRKILSLDGGGVRGLSTIMILRYIMKNLEEERGRKLEVWEEFDMIGGTSTGGLLAIMLGRLRMSLDECETAYLDLSRKIFTPAHHQANIPGRLYDFLQANGKFDSKPLEECIKTILRDHNLPETELLKEDDQDACKVFVCAVRGNNDAIAVIRSYKSRANDRLFDVCKIWEAARATSAASRLFEPITIGPFQQKFVDGALRHNNPIDLVDQESSNSWPQQNRLIISIGTGSAPGTSVTGNILDLVNTLAKIVTDAEERNNIFRAAHRDMVEQDRLFRFNVYHGLADVGLEEFKAVDRIADHTDHYLDQYDTSRAINKCVSAMVSGGQRLNYPGSEDLATYLETLRLDDVFCELCEHCKNGIPYNSISFLCYECDMTICYACHSQHNASHMTKILQVEHVQWQQNMEAPTASCRHCAQDRKTRYHCKMCDVALCMLCAQHPDRRIAFFSKHSTERPDDRKFVLVLHQYWATTRKAPEVCPCIDVPGAVDHCQRCATILTTNQRYISCRTCNVDFGCSQLLCEGCYLAEDSHHKSKHEFLFVDLYKDTSAAGSSDELKVAWRCRECPGREFNENGINYHEHQQFYLMVDDGILENQRVVFYRRCNRIRADTASKQLPDPSTHDCQLCSKFLAFNQEVSVCLTKGCLKGFCTSCTQEKRARHRHRLFNMTYTRPDPKNLTRRICDYCSSSYFHGLYVGIMCADCRNYDVCIKCLIKVQKGTAELPRNMVHNNCMGDGSNWIFFRQQ